MMHCEACVYDRGPHADWCESFWAKTLRRLRATFERRVTNAPADAIVLVTPTEADAIAKILKYNGDTGDRYFGRRFKVEPLSSEKALDELNAMIDSVRQENECAMATTRAPAIEPWAEPSTLPRENVMRAFWQIERALKKHRFLLVVDRDGNYDVEPLDKERNDDEPG